MLKTHSEIIHAIQNADVEITEYQGHLRYMFSFQPEGQIGYVYPNSVAPQFYAASFYGQAKELELEARLIHAAIEAMPEEEWEWKPMEASTNLPAMTLEDTIALIGHGVFVGPYGEPIGINTNGTADRNSGGDYWDSGPSEEMCNHAECLWRHKLHRRYERAD